METRTVLADIKVGRPCKPFDDWVNWLGTYLHRYGARDFGGAVVRSCQGAESRCQYCQQPIFLDILEGCGVPAWKTADGDYGCDNSPDTCDDGCGSHLAEGCARA